MARIAERMRKSISQKQMRLAAPFGARLLLSFERATAVVLLAVLFLGVAFWNGYPLVFYDTGAYLAEGLEGAFLAERSPVYSFLLLFAGGKVSLWLPVLLQALMTAFLLLQVARIETPRLSLPGLGLIGLALMGLTGIGWYVGQVEPDCMTAILVLGTYLLLFRWGRLGWARWWVGAVTGLSIACHPSHIGLTGGLLIAAALVRWLPPGWRLPRPTLLPGTVALVAALALTIAANFVLTRQIFIVRSGPVFLVARLMQDGIVKKLLDDACLPPGGGKRPYELCAYKTRLKTRADAWLWSPDSVFHREGGFNGPHREEERIILDSFRRYPWLQIRMAVRDSIQQFFLFKTGDGIESQEWVLRPDFVRLLPDQLPAYLSARQQHQKFRFHPLNLIHVTVGVMSILGSLLLLQHLVVRRRWDEAVLPALVLLALIGNAIICGTFSNPHDRYQSRLIWLPAFVLLLALARDPAALRPEDDGAG